MYVGLSIADVDAVAHAVNTSAVEESKEAA
jgi:hypothetical protein